jgi:hypothetical protein
MNEDIRHLDLLAIFHYIVAAITALFGCLPIIHLVLGIAMLMGALDDGKGNAPPPAIGLFFVMFALVAITVVWAAAIAMAIAGRRLKRRQSYTYCLVVAAIECIFVPFGTLLGVFTLIVLMRPSVKALFDEQATPPLAASSGSPLP